jgi:hypothetical protein
VGSSTLTDSSVNNVSIANPTSTVTISNEQVKYGSTSIKLIPQGGGSPSSIVTTATSNLIPGSQDFTFELWHYWTAITTSDNTWILWTNDAGTTTYNALGIMNNASNLACVNFVVGGQNIIFGSKNQLIVNQWNHIAFTKQGSTWRCFINGVLDSAGARTGAFSVGVSASRIRFFNNTPSNGTQYISDMRLTIGGALYTSNFTPPTAQLTADSGTVPILIDNAQYGVNQQY